MGGFFFGLTKQSNTYIGIAVKKPKNHWLLIICCKQAPCFFSSLFIRQLRGSEQKGVLWTKGYIQREKEKRKASAKWWKTSNALNRSLDFLYCTKRLKRGFTSWICLRHHSSEEALRSLGFCVSPSFTRFPAADSHMQRRRRERKVLEFL